MLPSGVGRMLKVVLVNLPIARGVGQDRSETALSIFQPQQNSPNLCHDPCLHP